MKRLPFTVSRRLPPIKYPKNAHVACGMLMAACGCRIKIKLVAASTGYIFTVFIMMNGWYLLASAIVQCQRKIMLLN